MENKTKKLNDIDFSPLDNLKASKVLPLNKYWLSYLISVLALIGSFSFFPFYSVPIVLLGIAAYFSSTLMATRYRALKQFVTRNGWKLGDNFELGVPNSVRFRGESHRSTDIVSGQLEGATFLIGKHSYQLMVAPLKANKHERYRSVYMTIMHIKLSSPFPFILLDSKNNSSGATEIPTSVEKISLEGNFDTYFQMYSIPSARIDALSLITPDVMQTAMNSSADYDIEIYGDDLFIFVGGSKVTGEDIKALFNAASQLLSEVQHKAKSYRPSEGVSFPLLQATDMKALRNPVGLQHDSVIIYWIKIIVIGVVGVAFLFLLAYLFNWE